MEKNNINRQGFSVLHWNYIDFEDEYQTFDNFFSDNRWSLYHKFWKFCISRYVLHYKMSESYTYFMSTMFQELVLLSILWTVFFFYFTDTPEKESVPFSDGHSSDDRSQVISLNSVRVNINLFSLKTDRLQNCCWASPKQWFLFPSPPGQERLGRESDGT